MTRALVFVLVVAAALGASPLARAGGVSSLSVAAKPADPKQLTLVAHLRGSRAGDRVAFFVVSTEFGPARRVPIGVAQVGRDGVARVSYAPTWSGEQQFVAELDGAGANARPATAAYRVTTSAPGPLYAGANPGRPLASVGHVFLDVILTVVALVWLSLFVTLALAFGRLPQLAGDGTDRGGP